MLVYRDCVVLDMVIVVQLQRIELFRCRIPRYTIVIHGANLPSSNAISRIRGQLVRTLDEWENVLGLRGTGCRNK